MENAGCEAASVLGALLLAALWPERFPRRWVTVDEFGQLAVLLGDRSERESLKAAIRRGLRCLKQKLPDIQIGTRRTRAAAPSSTRRRRELDRRLIDLPDADLESWLLTCGPELISPEAWRAFQFRERGVTPTGPDRHRTALLRSLQQAEHCLREVAEIVAHRGKEANAVRRARLVLVASLLLLGGRTANQGRKHLRGDGRGLNGRTDGNES